MTDLVPNNQMKNSEDAHLKTMVKDESDLHEFAPYEWLSVNPEKAKKPNDYTIADIEEVQRLLESSSPIRMRPHHYASRLCNMGSARSQFIQQKTAFRHKANVGVSDTNTPLPDSFWGVRTQHNLWRTRRTRPISIL